MLDRLQTMISARPPGTPDEDWLALGRAMTYQNIQRLRVIAWAGIGFLAALVYIDYSVLEQAQADSLRSWKLLPYVMGLRLLLVGACVGFLLIAGRLDSPDKIAARHRFLEKAFVPLCLVGLTALNGLLQPFRPGIGLYLMAVFTTAAFIHLDGRRSLITYGLAWLVLTVMLYLLQTEQKILAADMATAALMTALALVTSRVIYVTRVKEFLNQRLVERQKEELEQANRRLAETNDMLHRLSFLDALTSVPNRRYFDEILNREWRRAARERVALALIMVDIDHFKAFNDTYGHQAGDDCLVVVAWALTKALKRPGDMVARYGGEEFAAILPGTDLNGAVKIAEQMRRAVTELKLAHSGSPQGRVTVSLGAVSQLPDGRRSPAGLVAAADAALYRAKGAGRDRVAVGPEEVAS